MLTQTTIAEAIDDVKPLLQAIQACENLCRIEIGLAMLFSPAFVWRNAMEECPEIQLQAIILEYLPRSTRHLVFNFSFSRMAYTYRLHYYSAMRWSSLPRMTETGKLPFLVRVDFVALCLGLVLPDHETLADHIVPYMHPFEVKHCKSIFLTYIRVDATQILQR